MGSNGKPPPKKAADMLDAVVSFQQPGYEMTKEEALALSDTSQPNRPKIRVKPLPSRRSEDNQMTEHPLQLKDNIPTSPPPPKSRNNEFQPLLQKPNDDHVDQAATLSYAILLYYLIYEE